MLLVEVFCLLLCQRPLLLAEDLQPGCLHVGKNLFNYTICNSVRLDDSHCVLLAGGSWRRREDRERGRKGRKGWIGNGKKQEERMGEEEE